MSCFPTIQNEIIMLIANQVCGEIISKIKEAKYYSVLVDCTPDTSHHEEVPQIVSYAKIDNGIVSTSYRIKFRRLL
jgi:hypothetical protein